MVLRAPRDGDAEARLGLGSDPDIHRMFGGSRDRLAAMTRERAERWADVLSRHPHAWVIERRTVIGEIRLDVGPLDLALLRARPPSRHQE